jgi:hypothetical protein
MILNVQHWIIWNDFQINLSILVFACHYRCCCLVSYSQVLNLSTISKYTLVYHVVAYVLYINSRVRICIWQCYDFIDLGMDGHISNLGFLVCLLDSSHSSYHSNVSQCLHLNVVYPKSHISLLTFVASLLFSSFDTCFIFLMCFASVFYLIVSFLFILTCCSFNKMQTVWQFFISNIYTHNLKNIFELHLEGPEKATRGRMNGSQSKFLTKTWPISWNRPDVSLF